MSEHAGTTWTLQADGAARGNPGPAVGAAVLVDASGQEVWADVKKLGETTNNVAEYEALIFGLEAAAERCSSLKVTLDSELVVKQLAGEYKVRQDHLRPLFERARGLLAKFDAVDVTHVPREENARADALANKALDGEAEARQGLEDAPELAGIADGPGRGVYELTVKGHFDAAHALRGYPGKCKELHGHTWDVEVTVSGSELDDIGILFDFAELKKLLGQALDPLDHAHLNDIPPFDVLSPTGENLARHIHGELVGRLPANVSLLEVVVWESPEARLSYRGG